MCSSAIGIHTMYFTSRWGFNLCFGRFVAHVSSLPCRRGSLVRGRFQPASTSSLLVKVLTRLRVAHSRYHSILIPMRLLGPRSFSSLTDESHHPSTCCHSSVLSLGSVTSPGNGRGWTYGPVHGSRGWYSLRTRSDWFERCRTWSNLRAVEGEKWEGSRPIKVVWSSYQQRVCSDDRKLM